MDQYSSILGAFAAGKLPSQDQTNRTSDRLLKSTLIQIEASTPDEGTLSPTGKRLAGDVRNILEAYMALGANKNGDDTLQEGLWSLHQGTRSGDVKVQDEAKAPVEEARSDAQQLSSALNTLLHVVTGTATGTGSFLLEDLASFMRLELADAAETVEEKAAKAKEQLRQTDQEVQEGKRDALGVPLAEDGQKRVEEMDTKEKFEHTMDTVKEVGSKTIGVGQQTRASGQHYTEKSRSHLSRALDKIVRRSQDDPEFQSAIRTVFGLTRKWLAQPSTSNEPVTLETFVDDPTGNIHAAVRHFRTLIERCAGGKSLDDLLNAFNDTTMSIRSDEELTKFVDDYLVYVQHNVESVDYFKSEESQRTQEDLNRRANDLGLLARDEQQGKRREYHQTVSRLEAELKQYQQGMLNDPDFRRLQEAHLALGKTLATATKEIVGSGNLTGLQATTWIWQDLLNVYLPRIIAQFKNIPLPRTEYADPDMEFVFENADISSLKLLPGRAHIRQVADMDISQDKPTGDANTSVGAKTELKLQGVQLDLHDVSFYYHDKQGKMGPSTFTGLLDVALPEKGLDIDVTLSLLPTTAHSERQKSQRFFKIEKVDIDVSQNIELSIKKSNHPVLSSVFKPAVKGRFRSALESALEQNVKLVIDFLDSTAWDVNQRAKVFKDGGAPTSAAYAGAVWSEIGRLRQLPGPFTGWFASGYGVIKDDKRTDKVFAVGTEPQVLPGSKHGPKSQFTEQKSGTSGASGGVDASGPAAAAKEKINSGAREGKHFQERVETKRNQEAQRDGWRSDAFDAFLKR